MHFILVNGAEPTEIDPNEPAVVRMTNALNVSWQDIYVSFN